MAFMKNILITSVGRRVELLQAFRSEQQKLLPNSQILAIDYRPNLSPACQLADQAHSSPKVIDPKYIDFLLEYCGKYNVGLVIPTIDTELLLLAQHRKLFYEHGIELCISDVNLIEHCRDKRRTGSLFKQYSVKYPEIYSKDNLHFPCFVKPFDGSCSIGAKHIPTKELLDDSTLTDDNMLFMEFIDKSYSEYTVDAYFDKNSILKCILPRKRIEVRSGEVSKGVTKNNFLHHDLIKKFSYMEGARGCLTMQFFVNEKDDSYIGLEINPRFGGGYPLSYAAGANYPAWLIREYILNEPVDFFETWEKDLLMLRYDAKILVHHENI